MRNGPDGALEYVPLGVVDLANILANIGNGTLTINVGGTDYTFTANQSTNTSVTIPEPGNGTITVMQGQTTLGYFTVNQSGNATVTIPEPGNGTITVKQGDTTLGYFTVNQSGNTTITIPEATAVNNGMLTVMQGQTQLGYFTANQAGNTTITIPEPQIPTVGNGTITVMQGQTTLGYFTVNQSGNTTITIPAAPTLPTSTTFDVVTDIRYDTSTKQLQKKTRQLVFGANGLTVGNESAWTMITNGQAVPLSDVISTS